MDLLFASQQPPSDVRSVKKATTSISPHTTALSDEGMDTWWEARAISLFVFPTLASHSNGTFTGDSVVCLKMLSYNLAKEIKYLFETTDGPCIWNSAYYLEFGGIEDLFPSKHG